MKSKSSLAILGGPKSVTKNPRDMFTWPIITKEDEKAVLEVLRRGAMSNLDVTLEFEKEFAAWQGRRYALAHNRTHVIKRCRRNCRHSLRCFMRQRLCFEKEHF